MTGGQLGVWSPVEDDIASALDEAGGGVCDGHLKRPLGTGTEPAFIQRQIDALLRAVDVAQRDAGAYIALAERSGLTARDCIAMATILAAKDDPAAALTWTERGLGIETSYDLRAKHRELLTVLGRHDEAIQNEWSHFTQVPTIYSYQPVMELVPETARATWHDRAIEAAVQSGACRAHGLLGPARGPGAREPLPQGRLHPRVREGRHGSDSRAGAKLPGEGPRPLGSARMISPVAPQAACPGGGLRGPGGIPDDELRERVRELRARGRSPKEIAR